MENTTLVVNTLICLSFIISLFCLVCWSDANQTLLNTSHVCNTKCTVYFTKHDWQRAVNQFIQCIPLELVYWRKEKLFKTQHFWECVLYAGFKSSGFIILGWHEKYKHCLTDAIRETLLYQIVDWLVWYDLILISVILLHALSTMF